MAVNRDETDCHVKAIVQLPSGVRLPAGELVTKKGPVVQTAILAGVMAAKRTSELIPSSPLADDCKVTIEFDGNAAATVKCTASVQPERGG